MWHHIVGVDSAHLHPPTHTHTNSRYLCCCCRTLLLHVSVASGFLHRKWGRRAKSSWPSRCPSQWWWTLKNMMTQKMKKCLWIFRFEFWWCENRLMSHDELNVLLMLLRCLHLITAGAASWPPVARSSPLYQQERRSSPGGLTAPVQLLQLNPLTFRWPCWLRTFKDVWRSTLFLLLEVFVVIFVSSWLTQ